MGDKPIGIVVASWNPNEPRFIVTEATESLSDNRKFVNGKCVENQRLKIVYSVEDIVEVLNNYGEFEKEYTELEKENEQLRQELAELLAVHTKIVETLDSEFVSKALEDGDGV